MGENQEHYPRDLRGYAGQPPHALAGRGADRGAVRPQL
jgi:allantoinase